MLSKINPRSTPECIYILGLKLRLDPFCRINWRKCSIYPWMRLDLFHWINWRKWEKNWHTLAMMEWLHTHLLACRFIKRYTCDIMSTDEVPVSQSYLYIQYSSFFTNKTSWQYQFCISIITYVYSISCNDNIIIII